MAAARPTRIACDAGVLEPDLLTIDTLARLQLAARRLGRELRVENAGGELCELLDFVGLRKVLGVEPGREPEEREQRLGVEEERELDDPAV
jgi:hypothetical protein